MGSLTDQVQPATASDAQDFGQLLDKREIRAVFQPLIGLADGQVVGFESLARGPAGSRFESPAALFTAAGVAQRVPELDWACRAAAFEATIGPDGPRLPATVPLFINCEPTSVRTPCPADLLTIMSAAEQQLHVVMEVTERDIAHDPAGLLSAVARARSLSWGVALDDVGAEPNSLAVMPFVNPDVIKLDLRLIQGRTTSEVARIVNAVLAQAELTGATILAEGIETTRHEEIARAMGATVGQGWLYGRPGPLPEIVDAPDHALRLHVPKPARSSSTPFEIVAAKRTPTRTTKDLLIPMSKHLEEKGLDSAEPPVLLACFQEVRHFTDFARRRFARLAKHAAFVGAVGAGMPVDPAPGVRGGLLHHSDPLRGEWDVIAVGPHFAGALVARDCGDSGPDLMRRFDFVITYDRDLVVEAARSLLTVLAPDTAAS
jgi:EAL domain-containing protein (putative c-di-GMP-specific phosphodiesterase class I)